MHEWQNSNLDLCEIQQLWTSGYNLSGYYDVIVRTLIAKSMDGHKGVKNLSW